MFVWNHLSLINLSINFTIQSNEMNTREPKAKHVTYERTKNSVKITGDSCTVSKLVEREQNFRFLSNLFRPFLWLWSFFK